MTWRDELRTIVEERSSEELPDVIGELARANAVAIQRLNRPSAGGNGAPPVVQMTLTAKELEEAYGISQKWAYAHKQELGAVKLGRSVRFPEKKVRRYLEAHRC